MNVQIETVIGIYDEKIAELQKENLMLKAQLKQLSINSNQEESEEQADA